MIYIFTAVEDVVRSIKYAPIPILTQLLLCECTPSIPRGTTQVGTISPFLRRRRKSAREPNTYVFEAVLMEALGRVICAPIRQAKV